MFCTACAKVKVLKNACSTGIGHVFVDDAVVMVSGDVRCDVSGVMMSGDVNVNVNVMRKKGEGRGEEERGREGGSSERRQLAETTCPPSR